MDRVQFCGPWTKAPKLYTVTVNRLGSYIGGLGL